MKNVLITGGTGGIGTALTKCFVENGYHVIATHNSKSDPFLVEWLSDNGLSSEQVAFINLNLIKAQETIETIDALLVEKQIDILINNAGITADATFLKMSLEQWYSVLQTNLVSLFGISQGVAKQMVARGSGNIINISSINGLKGQYGQTNYSASKAGILGFTKALAQELAAKGVRVNAICPGYTMTPMVSELPSRVLDKIKGDIPTGNLVDPKEIAFTALFIAQSMPSLTGETISVNGGHYIS
ncbi:SDR family NAD(P)-dependent oxidoreductase [Pseudomonadales bacterium]|nr:SDR family NAD(P)-dependent oxidoreductase [Pseudomonadales bacterium]